MDTQKSCSHTHLHVPVQGHHQPDPPVPPTPVHPFAHCSTVMFNPCPQTSSPWALNSLPHTECTFCRTHSWKETSRKFSSASLFANLEPDSREVKGLYLNFFFFLGRWISQGLLCFLLHQRYLMCFVKWAHFERKRVHKNKNVISWEGRSTHMLSNLENLNQVRLSRHWWTGSMFYM